MSSRKNKLHGEWIATNHQEVNTNNISLVRTQNKNQNQWNLELNNFFFLDLFLLKVLQDPKSCLLFKIRYPEGFRYLYTC